MPRAHAVSLPASNNGMILSRSRPSNNAIASGLSATRRLGKLSARSADRITAFPSLGFLSGLVFRTEYSSRADTSVAARESKRLQLPQGKYRSKTPCRLASAGDASAEDLN